MHCVYTMRPDNMFTGCVTATWTVSRNAPDPYSHCVDLAVVLWAIVNIGAQYDDYSKERFVIRFRTTYFSKHK